jgi:hypothetical protein
LNENVAASDRTRKENADPLIPALNEALKTSFAIQSARGVIHQRFCVAGVEIEAQIVGEALARVLTRSFSPMRRSGGSEPDIVWRVCESVGGISYPPAPGRDLHGVVFAGHDHEMVAERRLFTDTVFDPSTRLIHTVAQPAGELALYERAKPLLRFLNLLLYARGVLVTHAALVGQNGRGVLVTGRGGMGKTTTAAVALLRGLDFVSDDYVAIGRQTDGYYGHMLFSSLMLDSRHIAKLPRVAEIADYPFYAMETKALVYPDALDGARLCQCLKIAAVAVPAIVGGGEGRLIPISRGEALRALGPSSVFSSPWREKSRFDFYEKMLARLPCYRLELGNDLERLVEPLEPLFR